MSNSQKVLMISAKQIKQSSHIQLNVDEKTLSNTILDTQFIYLRQILGYQRYENVIAQIVASKAEPIPIPIPADTIELIQEYIQPYLCHAVVQDLIVNSTYKLTEKGLMKFGDTQASPISPDELEYAKNYFDNRTSAFKKILTDYVKKLPGKVGPDTDNNSEATGWHLPVATSCFNIDNSMPDPLPPPALMPDLISGTLAELRTKSDLNDNTGASLTISTDFGTGLWYYDKADSTSEDNTGTVYVSLNGKRYKRIFTPGRVAAAWFGALPDYDPVFDAGTDNGPAIQAATAYVLASGGGSVYLGPGNWLVSTRVLCNTNEQVPMAYEGPGLNVSYSDMDTRVKGATIFSRLPGGVIRCGLNEDGTAFYDEPNFLYKAFAIRNMSFYGLGVTAGLSAVQTFLTRTALNNVSATKMDYLIYQPPTSADGKGNYCDGSDFDNPKVYNSRKGGLYLYKSDITCVKNFKMEANTATTENALTIIGASSFECTGAILGGNATVPALIPGSAFIDIVNCNNTDLSRLHVEHSYFEHIVLMRDNSRNLKVDGIYPKFESYNVFSFKGLVRNVTIDNWFTFGVGPKPGYYDLNAINTSTNGITVNNIILLDETQAERPLKRNGSMNGTLNTPSNLLTKENVLLTGAMNELVFGDDYIKAQQAVMGGGSITYTATGFLKWSSRLLSPIVDKILGASGFIEMTMPAAGTVIDGLFSTPSVTTTSEGIPLNSGWDVLLAEHTTGQLATVIKYYIVRFATMGTNTLKPNQFVVAVRSSDDSSLRLITGHVMRPGDIVVNGKLLAVKTIQRAQAVNFTMSALTEALLLNDTVMNGLNYTATLKPAASYTGTVVYVRNKNAGLYSWLIAGATVIDVDGITLTRFANETNYTMQSDGTNWIVLHKTGKYDKPITDTNIMSAPTNAILTAAYPNAPSGTVVILPAVGTGTGYIKLGAAWQNLNTSVI